MLCNQTKIPHGIEKKKKKDSPSFSVEQKDAPFPPFPLFDPHNILYTDTNGVHTEPSGVMDQRPAGQDPQGLMGAFAMADAVAVEQQRQVAEEKDPGRVRAPEEAAPSTLPRTQGRVRLGLAGHSLLHGPVRVCLQGM